MFRMRFTQAFQSCLADAFGKPKEPCLHVRRKRGDFSGDGIVEDFDTPCHTFAYISILRYKEVVSKW